MVPQALVHVHQVVHTGFLTHREERLVDQQTELRVQRRADRGRAAGRLEERAVRTGQPVAEILLDPLDLLLAHRHGALRQPEVRGPGLLQRTRTPLVLVHRGRRQAAVMPQQRLHLDGNQLHPPAARHVVPGPAVRSGHRGNRAPQLVPAGRQRRVRRHVVREPQLVHAEPLRGLGDLRGGARVRREVRTAVPVHAHTSGVAGRPDRVREVHELPGVGRVRWRGLLPEPTCRHGGCPLLRLADEDRPAHGGGPGTAYAVSPQQTPPLRPRATSVTNRHNGVTDERRTGH